MKTHPKKVLKNLSKLSLIAVVIVVAAFALGGSAARACEHHAHASGAKSSGANTEWLVPKVHCMGCAHKIKKNLKPMEGVSSVNVDVTTHKLKFQCQDCDLDAVKAKLQEIGYPASEST